MMGVYKIANENYNLGVVLKRNSQEALQAYDWGRFLSDSIRGKIVRMVVMT